MATRDYKKRSSRAPAKKKGGGVPGWLWALVGLAAGLLVAFLVWLNKLQLPQPPEKTAAVASAPAKPAAKDARSVKKETPTPPPAPEAEKKAVEYDFYKLLPEMEVRVPTREPEAATPPPLASTPTQTTPAASSQTAPATAAASYILQVGAFSTLKDADARKAELALLGIIAGIQEVSVNGNTVYRVRIGPISNSERLEQMRAKLKQNDIPYMQVRDKS